MMKRTIRYSFMGGPELTTTIPSDWPRDATAEVLAFRAGANPGDIFELIDNEDGSCTVIATGNIV